ncbi:Phosphoribosylaminoimidazole-succinocarboxamide synthase [Phialemonium atrogriseum]|uniref:Phosphoribosylaminoimidazole-succinocarboxamide synthase n=1 Tax=Phialemonium atrogriseum TaxID=1093897 RepID=A0AAJ0C0Q1_9PEZI|nr:Phosphoribosylaminoimidazole-succinocarboxamide synthase [Phialemonium atrogriseum]KAK1766594.1 Phosphoribosylaminoimidazole-succinocarboxamide synthase [Phialemonium atrogriseum]
MSSQAVASIELTSLPLIAQGKVRNLYEIDESTLLFVTSDRISAYDVVLVNGIPDKGKILTQISSHWFSVLSAKIPNLKHHLITLTPPRSLSPADRALVHGRSMQVKKLRVFPVEVIVRGYLTGTAWKDYVKTGAVNGIPQPAGLEHCAAFPGGPIYTPSTKAPLGEKDENITPEQARKIVGDKYADRIAELAVSIYKAAAEYALARGIIIADTKFEFALDEANDEVVLVDEVLSPDSSRFWPASSYEVGREQESFDKQYLRNWLTSQGLNGKEGVEIPEEVVAQTREKYREVFELLTGNTLETVLAGLEQ